jgi:hypothetical protein
MANNVIPLRAFGKGRKGDLRNWVRFGHLTDGAVIAVLLRDLNCSAQIIGLPNCKPHAKVFALLT